jgi:hypothetical protein
MALPTLDAVFASAADKPRRLMLSQWLVNELFQTSDYTSAIYSNSQALANYYTLPEQYLWAKIAVAVGAPRSESDYISLPKNYVWKDIYDAVSGSSGGLLQWNERQAVAHIAAAYRGDTGNPANLATYIDWPWRYQVAAISVANAPDLPTFIRDFAGLKTLNHGVGPTINFTRNTNATYFDSNGILRFAPHNVLRNSQAAGSTNGVIGSGGSLPTHWTYSNDFGNLEVVGSGIDAGLSYVDVRFYGTNSSGSIKKITVIPEGLSQVPATSGQTWTGSFYLKLQNGSLSGVAFLFASVIARQADTSATTPPNFTDSTGQTSTLSRVEATCTITATDAALVNTEVGALVQNGQSIDFTLRIAAPQLERNNSASEYIPTTGVAKYDQPRFDHGPSIITVSGLSDTQYNGEYIYSGEVTGYPYYLKAGVADISITDGPAWLFRDLATGDRFAGDASNAPFPWLVTSWDALEIDPAGVTISQPNDNSKGLLIEESRTNLLQRSAEFNDAYWNKLNATVTANDTVAPDGTTTADAVFETVDNDFHAVSRGAVVPSTGTVTMSVFAKANGRSRFGIQVGVDYGDFNLSAVTASVPFGGISASIEPISNGWYRCAFTVAATADDAYILVFLDGASNSYAGDVTKGMYFWGAQAEQASFPTSYIPTTGATATRAADNAIVNPISSFYNQSEGTLFGEASQIAGNYGFVIELDANSTATRIGISTQFYKVDGTDTIIPDITWSAPVANVIYKHAFAYKSLDYAGIRSGSTLQSAAGELPASALTYLRIGSEPSAAYLNGHIRKVAYWPKRLSNTILQDITT